MVSPRLLSGLFAALLTSCTASADGLTPGKIEISLVFPLNDTYAPSRGPLPLVFMLSSQPFQPALASSLDLQFNYLLVETHNVSNTMASGAFDLGTLYSHSAENDYVFFAYSDKLAGREGQFDLNCFISSVVSYPSTDNSSIGDNKQAPWVWDPHTFYPTIFTTQSGAQAADIPTKDNNASTCLTSGGWNVVFNVTGYREIQSKSYAVLSHEVPTIDPQLPCAIEVDAATAASISAGMATATTTPASSSSSGAAASTAGILSGSGIVATFWSLLMLGLSVVLFIC